MEEEQYLVVILAFPIHLRLDVDELIDQQAIDRSWTE